MKQISIPIIIKFRANVIDEVRLIRLFKEIGIEIFHVDAMHPSLNLPDLKIIEKIRNQYKDIEIIGGNSVRDIETANLFLKNGANYISIGRLALEDLNKLKLIIENFKVHSLTF